MTRVPTPLRRTLQAIQADVRLWQETTFGPGADPSMIIAMRKKLNEEVGELELALTAGSYAATPEVREEVADVFIVLLGLSARLGIVLEDEFERKLAENRRRRWSAAQPGDVSRHIPAGVVPAQILGSDPT